MPNKIVTYKPLSVANLLVEMAVNIWHITALKIKKN